MSIQVTTLLASLRSRATTTTGTTAGCTTGGRSGCTNTTSWGEQSGASRDEGLSGVGCCGLPWRDLLRCWLGLDVSVYGGVLPHGVGRRMPPPAPRCMAHARGPGPPGTKDLVCACLQTAARSSTTCPFSAEASGRHSMVHHFASLTGPTTLLCGTALTAREHSAGYASAAGRGLRIPVIAPPHGERMAVPNTFWLNAPRKTPALSATVLPSVHMGRWAHAHPGGSPPLATSTPCLGPLTAPPAHQPSCPPAPLPPTPPRPQVPAQGGHPDHPHERLPLPQVPAHRGAGPAGAHKQGRVSRRGQGDSPGRGATRNAQQGSSRMDGCGAPVGLLGWGARVGSRVWTLGHSNAWP